MACDRFIYIEVLDGAIKKTRKTTTPQNKSQKPAPTPVSGTKKSVETSIVEQAPPKETSNKIDNQTIELIEDTLDAIGDEDGWAFLGDVGNLIVKKNPNSTLEITAFQKLTPMLKSLTDILEIDERESDKKESSTCMLDCATVKKISNKKGGPFTALQLLILIYNYLHLLTL